MTLTMLMRSSHSLLGAAMARIKAHCQNDITRRGFGLCEQCVRAFGITKYKHSFGARQQGKTKFFQEGVVPRSCVPDLFLDLNQLALSGHQIDLFLAHSSADVTRGYWSCIPPQQYAPSSHGISVFFLTELVGRDDFANVILAFRSYRLPIYFDACLFKKFSAALIKSTSSGFLHFFKTRMHTGIPRRIEKVRRKADDRVDVAILQQLGSDAALLCPPRNSTP